MTSPALAPRLDAVRSASRLPAPLIEKLARHLEEATDDGLFRMNPIEWAAQNGTPETTAVDLFLHATHTGILDFAWGVLCPGCAGFRTANAGLRALSEKMECPMCRLPNGGSVGDDIEVAFTVNPAIRHIRFHDPDTLDYSKDGPSMFASHFAGRGPAIADLLKSFTVAAGRLRADETLEIEIEIPEGKWFLVVPELHAGTAFETSPSGVASPVFEILEHAVIAPSPRPGKTRIKLRNRVASGVGWMIFPDPHSSGASNMQRPADRPFLTGRQLIASQTFRDLFRAESLPSEIGLEVKSLSMLFTDLKSSTQMYERIGDLRAFELVRQHFDVLRTIVAENGGAMVKTIGDAVMATFHEPSRAIAAAVDMHDRVGQVGAGELLLKIGVHDGACIAVQLNERLDYFGQTVNIAARVQNLAEAGEIVVTETVFQAHGVEAIVAKAKLSPTRSREALKGIDAPVPVVRLR